MFVCFRTKKASAHANRLFITKLPPMIGTVFFNGEAELTVFVGHRHGSEVTNVTKSYNYDFFCHNLEFVTSDPYICPTQTVNSASPLKKTVPIISGNFAMKSRFACAEAFSVRKHTNENPQV